ncbi:MAG: regulatory protein RecX [Thermodesulfovibrionales bacterium]|jgi:regulatory protein
MRGSYASHTAKAGFQRDSSLRKSVRDSFSASPKDPSALQYSYRLLTYRGRSEKELRQRLKQKGFDEHDIDSAIVSLTSNGFLDDRKLASALRRYAEESKHYGIAGTRRFLKDRGIPADIIDVTVNDMDETEVARKIIEKKMRSMVGDQPEKAARKLYGMLYRRGYSSETIKTALEHFELRNDFS